MKSLGHHARLRENELLFRSRALLVENLLRFARARTYLRALMTRKSFAVGVRNAILRNHLNCMSWKFMLLGPVRLFFLSNKNANSI